MKNKKYLSGIGGWLLFLIITTSISLVLEPVILLGIFSTQEHTNTNLTATSQWQTYKLLLGSIYIVMFVFKLYTLYALIQHRNPEVVSLTKRMLWITGPIASFCALILMPAMTLDTWELGSQDISGVIVSGIIAVIWTSYLNQSARVQNTYSLNGEVKPETANANIKVDVKVAENKDDEIYEKIADELDGGVLNKALWTKAYAACDGDEKRTRTYYINARFKQLDDSSAIIQELPKIPIPPLLATELVDKDSLLEHLANDDYYSEENKNSEFKGFIFSLVIVLLIIALYIMVANKKEIIEVKSGTALPAVSVQVTPPYYPPEATLPSAEELSATKENKKSTFDIKKAMNGDFSSALVPDANPSKKKAKDNEDLINPPAEGSLEAWRSLKLGMSKSQVIKLLGEPENKSVEILWSYPKDGLVNFEHPYLKVTGWKVPTSF